MTSLFEKLGLSGGDDAPVAVSSATRADARPAALEFPLEDVREVTPEHVAALHAHTEAEASGGWYPVGGNSFWHGGVHLLRDEGTALRSPLDGQVVAARLQGGDDAGGAIGSRNLVLVRHDLGQGRAFFSLYMHLAPLDGRGDELPWVGRAARSVRKDLDDGALVAPGAEVRAGEPLGWVGELTATVKHKARKRKDGGEAGAGKRKKRGDGGAASAFGVHWEAFSAAPLFARPHDVLRGIEGERTAVAVWAPPAPAGGGVPPRPPALQLSDSRWENIYRTYTEDLMPHLAEGRWALLVGEKLTEQVYDGTARSGNCVGWASGDWAESSPSTRMDAHCAPLLAEAGVDPGDDPWGTYRAEVAAGRLARFSVANRWLREELGAEPTDDEAQAHYLLLATELDEHAVTHIGVRAWTGTGEPPVWVCRTGSVAPFLHERAAQLRTERGDAVSTPFGDVLRFYRRRDGRPPAHLRLERGWPEVDDPDEDCFMEASKIEELFPPEALADGQLGHDELVAFYGGDPDVERLRRFTCRFQSEWSLDWTSKALRDEVRNKGFRARALDKQYGPYMWWPEAVAAGVELPPSPMVWHYNPITLVHELAVEAERLEVPPALRLLRGRDPATSARAGEALTLELTSLPPSLQGQTLTLKLIERRAGVADEEVATFQLVAELDGATPRITELRRVDVGAKLDPAAWRPSPYVSAASGEAVPFETRWQPAGLVLGAAGREETYQVSLRSGERRPVGMRYSLRLDLYQGERPLLVRPVALEVDAWGALMHDCVAAAVNVLEAHRHLVDARGWGDYFGSNLPAGGTRTDATRKGCQPNDCTTYVHLALREGYARAGAPEEFARRFTARTSTENGGRLAQALHEAGWSILIGVAWSEGEHAAKLAALKDVDPFNYGNCWLIDRARRSGRFVSGSDCDVPVSEFVWGYQQAGSAGARRHLALAAAPIAPLALNLGLHVVMLLNDAQDPARGHLYECHWDNSHTHRLLFTGPGWRHAPWGANILGTASGVDGYYCYLMGLPPGWDDPANHPRWSDIWQPEGALER